MYERDVPNVAGNVANPVPTETGANGAYCEAGSLRCTAPEYAAVNYVNRAGKSRNQRLFGMDVIYKSQFLLCDRYNRR
jgi:hypothetical protein